MAAPNAPVSEGLHGQLIALEPGFLLLPTPAVVEVVGMDSISVQTEGPTWWLGQGRWQQRQLPVISFEALTGAKLPARSRRSRAVVIAGFGTHLPDGLFMLVAQGYPHLTPLSPAALAPQPRRPGEDDLALSRVRLASTEAVIPDLESMELRIAEARAQIESQIEGEAAAGAVWEPGV